MKQPNTFDTHLQYIVAVVTVHVYQMWYTNKRASTEEDHFILKTADRKWCLSGAISSCCVVAALCS